MDSNSPPSSNRDYVVVFPAQNTVELRGVERPDKLSPGSALIEARTTLVSVGTELAILRGTHVRIHTGLWSYPIFPGYSFAGVVGKVGFSVYGLNEGDPVFCIGHHGSFAVMKVQKEPTIRIPPNLKSEEACFAHLGAISLHGVNRAELKGGESVAVIGQGVVGNLALQLSRLNGANQAIAIDRHDWKLQKSLLCGATAALSANDERWFEKAKSHTNGMGPDVVIEATGDPLAIEMACRLCTEGGRVILLGGTRGPTNLDFYSTIHRKDLRVIGAHSSNIGLGYDRSGVTLRVLLDQVLSLMAAGKLKTEPLISHRVNWEGIPDLYKKLINDSGGYLGIILDWTSARPGTPSLDVKSRIPTLVRESPPREASVDRVGFALVGCGLVAEIHAEALAHSQYGRLVAVADVDGSRARRLGEKYGVLWYTDLDKLLQTQNVSVVSVCTPPNAHGEIAEVAAAAKKHVLVEKPIETSLEKADRLISRCEKEGVKLGVVYQHRFREHIVKLQAAYATGQFGKIFLGSFQDRSSRKRDYFDAAQWRRESLVQFIGEGIHGVDLLQHFLGPVSHVFASASSRSNLPEGNSRLHPFICQPPVNFFGLSLAHPLP
jgi:L-iditol 2-dehydrogenase